jgi:hypothetical protein
LWAISSRTRRVRSIPSMPRSEGSPVSQMRIGVLAGGCLLTSERPSVPPLNASVLSDFLRSSYKAGAVAELMACSPGPALP